MCGIFAYLGPENPLRKCLQGLKGVASRGYDSAGVAGLYSSREDGIDPEGDKGKIFLFKQKGSVDALEKNIPLCKLDLAIGHTRWATHGKPTDLNAHPHVDVPTEPEIAIVHNGIIDNYVALKRKLEKESTIKSPVFVTDTDTEVIAQLIKHHYQKKSLLEAFSAALKELEGSFALVVIHKDYPDLLLAAVRDCPLAIGWNEEKNEYFISSDPNAFFGRDLRVTFLQKDQTALVTKRSLQIFDTNLRLIPSKKITFSAKMSPPLSKEGFSHYMLKEIFEQPSVLKNTLKKRKSSSYFLPEILSYAEELKEVNQIYFLGCGSSWHAAKLAADLFEELTNIASRAEIASEFRYRRPVLTETTLVVALSQSGETADTIAALREAKKRKALTLTMCNVDYSTLVREADFRVLLQAGPEVSVCSTKAFTSQITMLLLFCLDLLRLRGVDFPQRNAIFSSLSALPPYLEGVLQMQKQIRILARKYSEYDNLVFIGRQQMHVTCLEAALKLKEISYKNANGYPAGELKHGPIALLDETCPVVAFCTNQNTYIKMKNNLQEIKARGAPLLVVTQQEDIAALADDMILLPPLIKTRKSPSKNSPFFLENGGRVSPAILDWLMIYPAIFAGQLLAYETALVDQPQNIDRPRNLAKCVTVE